MDWYISCVDIDSAQAGQVSPAMELLEKVRKWEEEDLGSRPERLMEIYFLSGYIKDEVSTGMWNKLCKRDTKKHSTNQ